MQKMMIVFMLLPILSIQAQNGWKERKDEDGIKVYTKEVGDSDFDSFKAEMTVKTTVKDVVSLLQDVKNYSKIFPDLSESKVLKREGDTVQYQYTRTAAPWPVSDRDGIYKMIFHTNRNTGAVNTEAYAVPDMLPEKEDVVRIRKSRAYWRITPKANGMVQIEYEVHADPGGNIPSWLANEAAVNVPFDTFKNLKKELGAKE